MNKPILKKLPALLAILAMAVGLQAFTSCSSDDGPQYNEPSSSSQKPTEISSSSQHVVVEASSSSVWENPTPSSSNEKSSSSVGIPSGLKQFGMVDVYVPAGQCGNLRENELPPMVIQAGNGKGCYYLGKYPGYNSSGEKNSEPGETNYVGPFDADTGIRAGKTATFTRNPSHDPSQKELLCGGKVITEWAVADVALRFNDPCPEQEQ